MRVTHHGHSCLLIETSDARVLIDPGSFSEGYEALGDLSAVVATHQHGDHLDPAGLARVLERNPGVPVHVDPGTAEQISTDDAFAAVRDRDVRVSAAGQTVQLGGTRLDFVGELHAVIHDDLPRVTNVGVVVRDGDTSLFHPGDALDADPGDVDVLAVPLSAPWCAVKETIDFVRRVSPRRAVLPIHDAIIVPGARGIYLDHVAHLGAAGRDVIDLARGDSATM